tara:strand:- start:1085 stop:1720 length:636 start_codon:yes stop_codon:yes gene_type:complete
MNRIVAFGCSNTQGQALPDLDIGSHNVSKYAWPAVLAKNFGFDVWNRAHGGASNKFILYRLLNTDFNLNPKKNDIVIIQWTSFRRSCFIDEGKVLRMLPSDISSPVERHRESSKQHSTYYYEHLDSDYNAWYDTMVQINLAKAHLDSLGIKNLHFTWYDGPMVDVRPMWNKVDLINKSFSEVDYALDNSHPGVESQKEMAEFMQKYLEPIL